MRSYSGFRNPLLPLIGWPCPGARLAEAIPQARDALTSPDGHFAVVLETNAIATATVRDGQLYEITRIAEKDPKELAVGAEWASGSYVESWSTRLQAFQ